MADPRATVDTHGMGKSLSYFEDALESTSRVYSLMQDQIATLEATWSTDSDGAQPAFTGALNTWLENLKDVENALDQLLSKVGDQKNAYERISAGTTEASAAMQQAMAAGLPGFS